MARNMSPESPLVSIVVTTYNGITTISDCLDSVKKLHWRHLEVIIVDNASTDGSREEAARVLPSARFLPLSVNKGYGAGCNAGARVAYGEIIVFLNQDVIVDAGFLDIIIGLMMADKDLGICGSVILSWDGNRLVSTGQLFERWTGYAVDYGFGASKIDLRPLSGEVFSPNGAAFAVRKEAFERIGGFNEEFFMYFDETDLAWRARIAGLRVFCCSDASARHKIDPRRAHSAWARYYIDRNSLLSAVMNYELSSLVIFLPSSVIIRAVGILVLTLLGRRGHARSMSRALNDFFALLPRSWKERGSVHTLRKLRDREVMRKAVLASPKDVLKVLGSSLLPSTSKQGAKSR